MIKNSSESFFCSLCNYSPIRLEENVDGLLVFCPVCSETRELLNDDILVQESSVNLVEDIDNVRNVVWWHATWRDNWFSEIRNAVPMPLVHFGNKKAALDRFNKMSHFYRNKGRKWNLYSVMIEDYALVAPEMYYDNIFRSGLRLPTDMTVSDFDCYRYLNACESPGSVSIAVNPNVIKVLDKTALSS